MKLYHVAYAGMIIDSFNAKDQTSAESKTAKKYAPGKFQRVVIADDLPDAETAKALELSKTLTRLGEVRSAAR